MSYAERLAALLQSQGATEVHAIPDRDTAGIRKAVRLVDGAEAFVILDEYAIADVKAGNRMVTVSVIFRDNQEDLVIAATATDNYWNPTSPAKIDAGFLFENAKEEPWDGFRDVPVREVAEGIIADNYVNEEDTEESTMDTLQAIIDAGVFAIVFESVVPQTARDLTNRLSVPIIGIGCGTGNCDGEVAVITDLIGSYPWFVPPFARPEADVATSVRTAVQSYIERVSKNS